MTMNEETMHQDNNWHLDKRIPIALIFAMLCQVIFAVWAMSALSTDVEVLKRDLARVEKTQGELEDHLIRVVKIETKLEIILKEIAEMNRQLVKLFDRTREIQAAASRRDAVTFERRRQLDLPNPNPRR